MKYIFKSSYIAVTPSTHQKIISTLNDLEFQTLIGPKDINGIYKEPLKNALTDEPDQIFYCDFDRILHWAMAYPNELKNTVISHLYHDFLLIGRTSRAFKTHPETQTITENIANHVASQILGFKETRDIISACWRFTPRLAEKLLKLPAKNIYGFYCEWPLTAWRHAANPVYLEVEGLEWETPDKYRREIKEKGYDRWIKELQTSKEWKRRVNLLKDTIESICTPYVWRTS